VGVFLAGTGADKDQRINGSILVGVVIREVDTGIQPRQERFEIIPAPGIETTINPGEYIAGNNELTVRTLIEEIGY